LREFIENKITSVEKYYRACQVNDDPELSASAEAIVEVGKDTLHHKKAMYSLPNANLLFVAIKFMPALLPMI